MSKETANRNRKLVFVLLSPLLICMFCYLVYIVLERPRYIKLPISSPSSYLLRGDWKYTETATIIFPENSGRYYLWRRETDVYSKNHDPRSSFDSWASVIDYFDSKLGKYGWSLYQTAQFDPCRTILPESKFLPRGLDGYVIFRKQKTIDFATEPTICLAVWPNMDGEVMIRGFNVVLVTANPSFSTIWKDQLDLFPQIE